MASMPLAIQDNIGVCPRTTSAAAAIANREAAATANNRDYWQDETTLATRNVYAQIVTLAFAARTAVGWVDGHVAACRRAPPILRDIMVGPPRPPTTRKLKPPHIQPAGRPLSKLRFQNFSMAASQTGGAMARYRLKTPNRATFRSRRWASRVASTALGRNKVPPGRKAARCWST